MIDVDAMSADLKLEALIELLICKRVITRDEYEKAKKKIVETLNEEFEKNLQELIKGK